MFLHTKNVILDCHFIDLILKFIHRQTLFDSVTTCDLNYDIGTTPKFENSIPKSY